MSFWYQMCQIREFLGAEIYLNLIVKNAVLQCVPFGVNLIHFGGTSDIPGCDCNLWEVLLVHVYTAANR